MKSAFVSYYRKLFKEKVVKLLYWLLEKLKGCLMVTQSKLGKFWLKKINKKMKQKIKEKIIILQE